MIENFELKVVNVYPNDVVQLKLLDAIKSGAPIIVIFMK